MLSPSTTTTERDYSLLACFLCAGAILTSFCICSFDFNSAKKVADARVVNFDIRDNESAERQSGVTGKSVIGYLLLGASGGLAFLIAPPRKTHLPMLLAVGAYVAFCYLSVLWSIEPKLTIRKLGVATFTLAASIGYSRLLGLRGLAMLCMVTAGGGVLLGLLAELKLGLFRPWESGYAFVGLLDKNGQALWISLFLLPVLFVWAQGATHGRAVFAIAVAAFLLVLTNSRAALGSCLIAAMTGVFLRARPTTKGLLVSLGTLSLGIGVLVVALVGFDEIAQTVALGRTEHLGQLTGRLPLWAYVLGDFADRPLAGHGYAAYWNSDKIDEVSSEFFWQAHQAHSIYVDLLLGIGVVGLAVFLTAVATGLLTAFHRLRVTSDPIYLFVASIFVLALVNGFAESKFIGTGLSGLILFACLFGLAFDEAKASAADREPTTRMRRRRVSTAQVPAGAGIAFRKKAGEL